MLTKPIGQDIYKEFVKERGNLVTHRNPLKYLNNDA